MKRSRICLMFIAVCFCIQYCSAQCQNGDPSQGETSLVCSASNITVNVDLHESQTNPEMHDLKVVCTNQATKETQVKDLSDSAYSTLRGGNPWSYTIPQFTEFVNATNIICEMAGCFYGDRFYYLSAAQCSIESFVSTPVLSPSMSSTINGDRTQVFTIQSKELDIPQTTTRIPADATTSLYKPVSTPIHTLHQPITTPSEEFRSQTPAKTDSRGQYYVTLLAFPVLSFIFTICAMSFIIKQRTDSKREKKEIKLGNWITNDNLQYDVNPINVQKAIIHCSESSSTLYSGLLCHTNMAESPSDANGNSAKFHSNQSPEGNWVSDHCSRKDTSLQPTFTTVDEVIDASECSVYGNNTVEALDDIKSGENSPGYASKFPNVTLKLTSTISFKEINDDPYIFYNRDRDGSTMNSGLNFDQLDGGISGNDLMFLSTSSGYIKN